MRLGAIWASVPPCLRIGSGTDRAAHLRLNPSGFALRGRFQDGTAAGFQGPGLAKQHQNIGVRNARDIRGREAADPIAHALPRLWERPGRGSQHWTLVGGRERHSIQITSGSTAVGWLITAIGWPTTGVGWPKKRRYPSLNCQLVSTSPASKQATVMVETLREALRKMEGD